MSSAESQVSEASHPIVLGGDWTLKDFEEFIQVALCVIEEETHRTLSSLIPSLLAANEKSLNTIKEIIKESVGMVKVTFTQSVKIQHSENKNRLLELTQCLIQPTHQWIQNIHILKNQLSQYKGHKTETKRQIFSSIIDFVDDLFLVISILLLYLKFIHAENEDEDQRMAGITHYFSTLSRVKYEYMLIDFCVGYKLPVPVDLFVYICEVVSSELRSIGSTKSVFNLFGSKLLEPLNDRFINQPITEVSINMLNRLVGGKTMKAVRRLSFYQLPNEAPEWIINLRSLYLKLIKQYAEHESTVDILLKEVISICEEHSCMFINEANDVSMVQEFSPIIFESYQCHRVSVSLCQVLFYTNNTVRRSLIGIYPNYYYVINKMLCWTHNNNDFEAFVFVCSSILLDNKFAMDLLKLPSKPPSTDDEITVSSVACIDQFLQMQYDMLNLLNGHRSKGNKNLDERLFVLLCEIRDILLISLDTIEDIEDIDKERMQSKLYEIARRNIWILVDTTSVFKTTLNIMLSLSDIWKAMFKLDEQLGNREGQILQSIRQELITDVPRTCAAFAEVFAVVCDIDVKMKKLYLERADRAGFNAMCRVILLFAFNDMEIQRIFLSIPGFAKSIIHWFQDTKEVEAIELIDHFIQQEEHCQYFTNVNTIFTILIQAIGRYEYEKTIEMLMKVICRLCGRHVDTKDSSADRMNYFKKNRIAFRLVSGCVSNMFYVIHKYPHHASMMISTCSAMVMLMKDSITTIHQFLEATDFCNCVVKVLIKHQTSEKVIREICEVLIAVSHTDAARNQLSVLPSGCKVLLSLLNQHKDNPEVVIVVANTIEQFCKPTESQQESETVPATTQAFYSVKGCSVQILSLLKNYGSRVIDSNVHLSVTWQLCSLVWQFMQDGQVFEPTLIRKSFFETTNCMLLFCDLIRDHFEARERLSKENQAIMVEILIELFKFLPLVQDFYNKFISMECIDLAVAILEWYIDSNNTSGLISVAPFISHLFVMNETQYPQLAKPLFDVLNQYRTDEKVLNAFMMILDSIEKKVEFNNTLFRIPEFLPLIVYMIEHYPSCNDILWFACGALVFWLRWAVQQVENATSDVPFIISLINNHFADARIFVDILQHRQSVGMMICDALNCMHDLKGLCNDLSFDDHEKYAWLMDHVIANLSDYDESGCRLITDYRMKMFEEDEDNPVNFMLSESSCEGLMRYLSADVETDDRRELAKLMLILNKLNDKHVNMLLQVEGSFKHLLFSLKTSIKELPSDRQYLTWCNIILSFIKQKEDYALQLYAANDGEILEILFSLFSDECDNTQGTWSLNEFDTISQLLVEILRVLNKHHQEFTAGHKALMNNTNALVYIKHGLQIYRRHHESTTREYYLAKLILNRLSGVITHLAAIHHDLKIILNKLFFDELVSLFLDMAGKVLDRKSQEEETIMLNQVDETVLDNILLAIESILNSDAISFTSSEKDRLLIDVVRKGLSLGLNTSITLPLNILTTSPELNVNISPTMSAPKLGHIWENCVVLLNTGVIFDAMHQMHTKMAQTLNVTGNYSGYLYKNLYGGIHRSMGLVIMLQQFKTDKVVIEQHVVADGDKLITVLLEFIEYQISRNPSFVETLLLSLLDQLLPKWLELWPQICELTHIVLEPCLATQKLVQIMNPLIALSFSATVMVKLCNLLSYALSIKSADGMTPIASIRDSLSLLFVVADSENEEISSSIIDRLLITYKDNVNVIVAVLRLIQTYFEALVEPSPHSSPIQHPNLINVLEYHKFNAMMLKEPSVTFALRHYVQGLVSNIQVKNVMSLLAELVDCHQELDIILILLEWFDDVFGVYKQLQTSSDDMDVMIICCRILISALEKLQQFDPSNVNVMQNMKRLQMLLPSLLKVLERDTAEGLTNNIVQVVCNYFRNAKGNDGCASVEICCEVLHQLQAYISVSLCVESKLLVVLFETLSCIEDRIVIGKIIALLTSMILPNAKDGYLQSNQQDEINKLQVKQQFLQVPTCIDTLFNVMKRCSDEENDICSKGFHLLHSLLVVPPNDLISSPYLRKSLVTMEQMKNSCVIGTKMLQMLKYQQLQNQTPIEELTMCIELIDCMTKPLTPMIDVVDNHIDHDVDNNSMQSTSMLISLIAELIELSPRLIHDQSITTKICSCIVQLLLSRLPFLGRDQIWKETNKTWLTRLVDVANASENRCCTKQIVEVIQTILCLSDPREEIQWSCIDNNDLSQFCVRLIQLLEDDSSSVADTKSIFQLLKQLLPATDMPVAESYERYLARSIQLLENNMKDASVATLLVEVMLLLMESSKHHMPAIFHCLETINSNWMSILFHAISRFRYCKALVTVCCKLMTLCCEILLERLELYASNNVSSIDSSASISVSPMSLPVQTWLNWWLISLELVEIYQSQSRHLSEDTVVVVYSICDFIAVNLALINTLFIKDGSIQWKERHQKERALLVAMLETVEWFECYPNRIKLLQSIQISGASSMAASEQIDGNSINKSHENGQGLARKDNEELHHQQEIVENKKAKKSSLDDTIVAVTVTENDLQASSSPANGAHAYCRGSPHIPRESIDCNIATIKPLHTDLFKTIWKQTTPVVLKVKQATVGIGLQEATQAWLEEVHILSALRHPRLITFYGCCLDLTIPISSSSNDGVAMKMLNGSAIVMEYMENGDLYSFLQSNSYSSLSWIEKLKIAIDIGEGLAFLHASNMFHGDLQSIYVLLDSDKHAKLTGFGKKAKNISSYITTDDDGEWVEVINNQHHHNKHKKQQKQGTNQQQVVVLNNHMRNKKQALTTTTTISTTLKKDKLDKDGTDELTDQQWDLIAFGGIIYELVTGRCNPLVAPRKGYSHAFDDNQSKSLLTLTDTELTQIPSGLADVMYDCLSLDSASLSIQQSLSQVLDKLTICLQQENKQLQDRMTAIPDGFLCPITQDIMKDPVMLADGHSYERKAILDWLKRSTRSPLTNEELPLVATANTPTGQRSPMILDNYALKAAIENFLILNTDRIPPTTSM